MRYRPTIYIGLSGYTLYRVCSVRYGGVKVEMIVVLSDPATTVF